MSPNVIIIEIKCFAMRNENEIRNTSNVENSSSFNRKFDCAVAIKHTTFLNEKN